MTEREKVAVVVGGGQGIAGAAMKELATTGWRIVAMSPSGSAQRLAEELGGAGLVGSNRSQEDLTAVVDLAMTKFSRLDAVVNSAGHAARKPVLEIADDEWQEGFETYLLSVVRMARIAAPHLCDAGSGSIVNITTSSPFEPSARYPVSAVSRAGVASFAKLFSDEYAERGVRMNNVLPGFSKEDPDAVPPEWTQRIPMRRAAHVSEIAKVIRFLVSDESSYVTGQNWRVDGGSSRAV